MRVTCVLANTYCLKKAIPSKRQARQMEKRYGPAWRYIVKTCSLHGISGSEGTRADRCELVHGTAIGCSDSKPVYSRTCELNPVSAAGDIKISTNALQQAMEAGCFTSEENTPLGGTAHPDGAGQRDPLLEFMERNEEDAALMLAMWTSLRRCCLHATELSESLSRSARWFLHYLIQVRAVAAALRFYERLLCLGVQLQKWDVLLLIRSLPYEHCIANTDVQSTSWPKEHERLPWTERRLMKLRQSGRLRAGEGHGAAASPQPAKNGVECSLQGQKTAAAAPLRSNGCPPNVGTDAGSTTTVSQVVAADHVQRFVTPFPRCGQSGWVKRWLLYEASMGNIDVVDGKFVVSSQCFPDSDCLPMDDTGCNHSTASSVKDGETMVDVTTLLKHLMLLQDTSDAVFQRHNSAADNKLAKRGSVTKASRYHTPKSQHRHWPEALQVARMFLDFRSAVVGLNNRNGAQLKGCRLASGEFIDTLQRAVLASNSWKVTLRCLRAAEGYNISFDSSTLTKLFVMMAKAEPWLVSRTVERCTAHYILPKLSSETSVGYAARALWFTHVSSVKATREDDYLDLIGSSSMNLSACIKQAKVYIILSSSLLRVEFDRFRADTITQRAMAASARLGLHPQDRGALLPTTSGDCSRNNLHGSGHTGEHALTLPENLQRAFELLCVAVPRVVRLLSCTAVSQEDVASLSTMLFDVVCGDRGLCGLFGDLYTVKKVNWSTKEVKVAVAMASCVLKIIDVLCFTEQHCKPKDCGAGFMSVRQLLHLLTVATEVVETIPSHIARSVAIQECMLPLIRISSRLPKCVFCFLNVNTQNEKLLFGCFSETTPEAVSLTVRILLLLVRTDLVQRIFPLRTRLLVAAMLQPDNPLGMQVRRYIPQRHQKRLDMILYRRRKGGGIGGTLRFSTDHMAPLPRRWVAHTPEDIARIEATARMRSSVYSVALRYCNDKAEMERVLKSHTYQMEWEDALLMLSVSLFHLRLPPASFTVSFFAVVLSRLSTAAALPSSLWLQAASVYWAAVDHTSRAFVTNERNDTSPISSYHLHERVVFSQLLLPLLLVCKKSNMHDTGWGWLKCWAASFTTSERDTQHAVLYLRARSALQDRGAIHACVKLIKQGRHQQCGERQKNFDVVFLPLLCEIAVQHADWHTALRILLETGLPDLDETSRREPFPTVAVGAIMNLLSRSSKNLSSTALQLRKLQGDRWDLANASKLLLLLVRQRRWRRALQHVAEMLPKVEGSEGREWRFECHADANDQPEEEEPSKAVRARFLLYGLRACACGGCAEEAAVLYDRLKKLIGEPPVTTELEPPESASDSKQRAEDVMFSMCNYNERARKVPKDELESQLRLVAGQARSYFIRAMTKRTLFHSKKRF